MLVCSGCHTLPLIYCPSLSQALVLPFNILISKLAKDMEDRAMMVNLNYLSFGRYTAQQSTHNIG